MAGVFVTGASGFVGSAVVEALSRRGTEVVALSRGNSPSASESGGSGSVRIVRGDLADPGALEAGMAGCSAVVHLVGIIMESARAGVTFERVHVDGTMSVITAAKRAGIARFVHLSALGARRDSTARYHQTKARAEDLVKSHGLDWTIFRPSLIHGPRGAFMRQAAGWARKTAMPYLFMPYFARGLFGLTGGGLIQPVWVNDVATAVAAALALPATIGKTYDLGGPGKFAWPRLYDEIARAVVGRRRLTAPIPAWYARLVTAIVPAALLPFNRDQVIMALEENICDNADAERDLNWSPAMFKAALRDYAKML